MAAKTTASTTKEVSWITGAAKDDGFADVVTDGSGSVGSATTTIKYLLSNDPGSASYYGVYSQAEIQPYQSNASTKTAVAAKDTATTAFGGTISVNKATGIVTYTPPANLASVPYGSTTLDKALVALPAGATIADTFYYVIWMAEKGAYSTAKGSALLTGINDAPTSLSSGSGSVVEDTNPSAAGQLTVVDPDTGESGFQAATVAGALGSLTIDAGGNWGYSLDGRANALAQGEAASETLTVKTIDGTTTTVQISITGTNDAPTASADTASTSENAPVSVDALANDTDPDHNAQLSVTSASASKGSASVFAGQVLFDPGTAFDHLALGVTEDVTVTYGMTDEHGAASTGTVTVTVTGENDGPTANADASSGDEDSTQSIAVLLNDTDPDDGAVLSLTSASGPAGKGTVSTEGDMVVFTPGTAFDHLGLGASEVVEISYTMSDENAATSSSTITVTVTGVNDAATIDGTLTGVVYEDGVTTATGQAIVHDVDDGEAHFGSHGATDGTYGRFTFNDLTGDWTYALDNSAIVNALSTGSTGSDSLHITSADGTASTDIVVSIQGHTDSDPNGAATSWMVNHGLDTINNRTLFIGFDGNDVLKSANNVTYKNSGDQADGFHVWYEYRAGQTTENIEVVLVGYHALTAAQIT